MIKLKIALIFIVVLLWAGLLAKYEALKQDYDYSIQNLKAYESEKDSVRNKCNAFQYTISQLEYSNDSLIRSLDETRKELNIKDKQLKSLFYVSSSITKTDTIIFTDTIFKDIEFNVDTVLKDEWYSMSLHLAYPNVISTTPSFNSEKHIITSYKKETINPPKKFFLFRWFQKKHKVVEIEVIDKSPYVTNNNQRFIEVIQ